jgi:hypothetical protein
LSTQNAQGTATRGRRVVSLTSFVVISVLASACSHRGSEVHHSSSIAPPSRASAGQCSVRLNDVTFEACNPHPRFTSRPDCFDFDVQVGPEGVPDASACVPGRVKFGVAGPTNRTDELVATTVLVSNDGRSAIIELRLQRIIGSMDNLFNAPAGARLGTIQTIAGRPDHFELGPALLPSEIGVQSFPVLDVEK